MNKHWQSIKAKTERVNQRLLDGETIIPVIPTGKIEELNELMSRIECYAWGGNNLSPEEKEAIMITDRTEEYESHLEFIQIMIEKIPRIVKVISLKCENLQQFKECIQKEFLMFSKERDNTCSWTGYEFSYENVRKAINISYVKEKRTSFKVK